MSGVRLLNSAGGALFLHSLKKYRGMLNTFFLEEETIQAVAGEREFSIFMFMEDTFILFLNVQ
jgi:hypothetical protein